MYRFLLYSLILHLIIITLLIVSDSFETPPKRIQIQLVSMTKNNETKKTQLTPTPKAEKIEEKKEEPKLPPKGDPKEEAKKEIEKTVAVQKMLDKVLAEDIKEKNIEKSTPKVPLKAPKVETPKLQKKEQALVADTPREVKEDTLDPYKNAVILKLPEKKELLTEKSNNPYDNPVIYDFPDNKKEITEDEKEVQNIPSLPEKKAPLRKEIDASSVKEDDLTGALSVIESGDDITYDITSKESLYITDNDKRALMNQMSQCLASLGVIREKEETVILLIQMNRDSTIKEIDVLKDDKVVPKSLLSNVESRIIYLFNNPKCSKLILPEGKFQYWKKFTIKLNLKGLFE